MHLEFRPQCRGYVQKQAKIPKASLANQVEIWLLLRTPSLPLRTLSDACRHNQPTQEVNNRTAYSRALVYSIQGMYAALLYFAASAHTFVASSLCPSSLSCRRVSDGRVAGLNGRNSQAWRGNVRDENVIRHP